VTAINPAADDEKFSFTPFTRHPFFTHVNKWILERVICPGRQVIVDLGCGPGAVTELILERVRGQQPPPRVIGVDPSPSALAKARAAISSKFAEFVQGSAEWLSKLVKSADTVVFLNAIHLMPDKPQVLKEIRRVLKPGGQLAFNSTFFNGAYVEGTSGFWRRWIVRSVQALREKGIEIQHNGHAAAMEWYSVDQYTAALKEAGFRPTTVELLRIDMTRAALIDIGRFSLFIEGALPGVPLEEGAKALEVGLERTMSELGVESVPRHWLEVVAEAV
jgi:ubiquinone/menaquinone biosynthesis C-methylase UbiE